MATREQLLEVLSEYDAASPADLQHVVHLHEEQGGSLAELLLQQELIDEEDLFFLMSRRLAVPAIPAERLRYLTLSPEIRRRVPRALARECVLVPVDLDVVHGRLSVAMFDPTDQTALDKLRRVSRVTEIGAYLARRTAILEALDSAYSDQDDAYTADQEELPMLGSGVAADNPEAQAARRGDASASKVELDPAMAMEIQAFEEVGYYPEVEPAAEDQGHISGRQLEARSLFEDSADLPLESADPQRSDEDQTQPFMLLPEMRDEEAAAAMEVEVEVEIGDDLGPMEEEITQVRRQPDLARPPDEEAGPSVSATEAGHVEHVEQLDLLLRELLASVGILVAMLEERIDPTGGSCKEYGQLSRLVAREIGMDELAVARVSLAAHLYGLDLALKREVGSYEPMDVAQVFGSQVVVPGGLGPSLRGLGARALGLEDQQPDPTEVRLIRLVADYLELQAESEESSDLDTLVQLLRTGGGEPRLVDGLARAVANEQTPRLQMQQDPQGTE